MNRLNRIVWRALSWSVITTLLLAGLPARTTPVVYAVNTGFRNPTANIPGASGDGNGFEVTPQNAYADGGGAAQNINGAGDRHEYYNFGFNTVIPAGAVITGIEVRLDGWVDQAANNARYAVDLTWNVAQSFTAARSTPNLTSTEATYVLGGPNDLWGRTAWTVGELADEIFAVRITSVASGTNASQRDFFLDWVTVRVYYATARLSGTIFSDDDANGVRNGAEAGLPNVPITFFRDDGDGNFEGGG
jgi:hypothetical protein